MGSAWQQGPPAVNTVGRFLTPEPLPPRLLFAEPLRRRMRVRLGEMWIADSGNQAPLPTTTTTTSSPSSTAPPPRAPPTRASALAGVTCSHPASKRLRPERFHRASTRASTAFPTRQRLVGFYPQMDPAHGQPNCSGGVRPLRRAADPRLHSAVR